MMANFNAAMELVEKFEGGYVNHPADKGGETIFGIARKSHPEWKGWEQVDYFKSQPGFPDTAENDWQLKEWADDLYHRSYWDAIQGDKINSQEVAEEIMEQAVNFGVRSVSKAVQRLAGVEADGVIGPFTLKAINAQDPTTFIKQLNEDQKQRYQRIVANDPSQKVFLNGWMGRTT